jgi:hypothetical protein
MSDRPKILDHLGPFVKLPPVAAFGSTSERAYELYREAVGGHERKDETTTQHLVTRMMYIAEATGVVLRLGASWGLSHPALSLLRDRYEQTVRFSWLARQPNNHEMVKYVASHYAKSIKLYQSLPEAVRNELGKIPVTGEGWITEKPTKEQLKYLDRWNALDLRSMAQKRDALPPVSDCPLARESLSYFYTTGIYHSSALSRTTICTA